MAETSNVQWISYEEDSTEVKVGVYGFYVGDFGTSKVNNARLLEWYDRLAIDWRKYAEGIRENQWLEEFVTVQTELIRRYFTLHSLPSEIVGRCANDVDWTDEEINKMVNELRRFV
ncbi:hypothetical protein GCM10008934_16320 [Virgibacillus salarius]|uniref:hypothetical protein n=1 Tax=Virgibacillus salarius TaxID=447199 RepID=UPI0031CE7423